jgi:hypothetical protein
MPKDNLEGWSRALEEQEEQRAKEITEFNKNLREPDERFLRRFEEVI